MPTLRSTMVATALFSLAVILIRLSIPAAAQFAETEFPLLVTWFRPPYMYLVINCIIISIVASSKLQLRKATSDDEEEPFSVPQNVVSSGLPKADPDRQLPVKEETVVEGGGAGVDTSPALVEERSASDSTVEDKKVPPREKGGTPEEAKPKGQDTLESTWQTITGSRPGPLTEHLKKSETWGSHVRRNVPAAIKMEKSETFAGDRSFRSGTSDKANARRLGREPSLGLEELNRRVEAFIEKFNEEMRLQRQRSLIQQLQ